MNDDKDELVNAFNKILNIKIDLLLSCFDDIESGIDDEIHYLESSLIQKIGEDATYEQTLSQDKMLKDLLLALKIK